jgi:hypothetical protein
MSVLLLATLAIPGGLAALLTFGRPRVSLVIGGTTAVLALVAAASIDAADAVLLAGTVVSGSDGLRTVALTWSAGIVLLGLADALVGSGGAILGPSLIGLGTGVLALAVADAGLGFALLTAGGILAAVGPLAWLREGPPDGGAVCLRALRPLAAAGLLALVAVAWGASAAGPFSAIDPLGAVDPAFEVALGLGLLAVAAAVAIRMGAIPAHAWAARFAESVPAGAIPATLGWGAAGFALVALGWVDVAIAPVAAPLTMERGIIAVVAAGSILLGGVAAVLHDDLEHVLGYSIVQDAGVALLSFAVIRPEAAAAGRDWLVGMVAVKTGLAAWVLVTRSTFGVRRLSELGGWARSSPILALAFGLVLLGAVGLPGMATFTARGVLTELALPAPADVVVLLAAFAPVVYLGRILIVGLDRMADAGRAAEGTRPRLRGGRPDGWSGISVATVIRSVPGAVRENRLVLAAGSAVIVAVIGLAVATGGIGAAGSVQPLGGEPGTTGLGQPVEIKS